MGAAATRLTGVFGDYSNPSRREATRLQEVTGACRSQLRYYDHSGAMVLLAGTVGAPRIIDNHKAEIDSAGVELLLPRMDLVRGRICS